jgi:imidazolonepropionase-like amidohydrolase
VRKPSRPLAIVNANLFDGASSRAQPNSTIVIERDRIVAAGPAASVRAPANAEVIDAKGRTALPGLWDMHVHMSPNDGLLHIAAGVTSVRDLANENDSLMRMKKQIEAGEEIGPRITPRGFMDGSGPYAGPTKVLVDTEEQGRAAIETYAKLGYDGIKVYSSIKPELVPALIRIAHEKGMRVSGHVPAFMTAEQFVQAGADELQHINFVFLNFFDDVKDTRTPARFTAVAERAATLDLDSPQVQSFVKLLRERGVVVDPTIAIFEGMFTDRPGVTPVGYAPIASRLPPQIRRGLLVGGLPTTAANDQRYRDSAQALLRMVKRLHDGGVTLVPGTDAMPGFTLHRELELYVQAGIPAPEVLRIATSGAARVAKRERDLGTIEPGKLADLVLVDGDPTQRISDVRRTALVVKNGWIYEPAVLYRAIGVQP